MLEDFSEESASVCVVLSLRYTTQPFVSVPSILRTKFRVQSGYAKARVVHKMIGWSLGKLLSSTGFSTFEFFGLVGPSRGCVFRGVDR